MTGHVGGLTSRPERTRRLARSFGLRLAVTLLVTLAVLGVIRYEMSARDIELRVRGEVLAGIQRQGAALAASFDAHDDAVMGEMMARAVVDGMASEPGASDVILFGSDGMVVVSTDEPDHSHGNHGNHDDAAPVDAAMEGMARDVARTSRVRVSDAADDHAAYEFWARSSLGPGPTCCTSGTTARSSTDPSRTPGSSP